MGELTAGVDLGGTKIQTVVLRSKEVVGRSRVPTPMSGAEGVIAGIVDSIRQALSGAGGAPEELSGIGIGAPGAINTRTGVVSDSPNVPGFQDAVTLGPSVSKALGGVRVAIENDVRVAMIGEHTRGAGRNHQDVLGVFVGTGVGGGLVLEGTLREGQGAAGEIGHVIVEPGGRMCSDGRRGHLEAYAGRGRMEARARSLVKKGKKTILFEVMEHQEKTRLTSGVFAKALEENDEMTVALIEEAVWALGIALASAQNLLDLEAIIVGGGLGDRLGPPFVERIFTAMRPLLFVPAHAPKMLTTELGDLSGAVGAAILVGG